MILGLACGFWGHIVDGKFPIPDKVRRVASAGELSILIPKEMHTSV